MNKSKILTSEEIQELLSKHLRDENTETIAQRKTCFIGVAKLLSAVKIDMEAADKMGKGYFERTKEFLGE